MEARSERGSAVLDTPLCRRLGVRYPVFQAGMGEVARGSLALAVSRAGGLGVIGAAYFAPEELRREIRMVKEGTDLPFGVDILFAPATDGSEDSQGYAAEVEAQIRVVLDERVPVLVSGLGSPGRVVPEAHDLGMSVMSIVGSAHQARQLAAEGVDIIIASGQEGGGHVGRVGTMALVPRVVDAVSVPVVAGGGIADGRGLVAALALGAQAVWLGTRFVATVEATAHINYKQRLVEIDESGTVVSRAHSGKPVRMIRNQFSDEWAARESEIRPFPLQLLHVGREASRLGRIEGNVDWGVLPSGQSAGLVDSVESAAVVVDRIMAEARAVLSRWGVQHG